MELARGAPLPWHEKPAELARLWRWLDEQGYPPADPAYFMDKGHKWDESYREMCREEEQDRLVDEDEAFAREGRYFDGGDEAV